MGSMNLSSGEGLCGEVVVDNLKRSLWEIVNMFLIRFKLYITGTDINVAYDHMKIRRLINCFQ